MIFGITRDLLSGSETLEVFQDGIQDLEARIDAVLNTLMEF